MLLLLPAKSNLNSTSLPNPNTPLAFLPPEAAYQTSVALYVLAGSFGVLLWDILDNAISDYNFLFRSRITLPTIVYFISRIGSLAYITGAAIFQTAPINNCSGGETIPDIFYPISLSGSALLFFFRLRAIYMGERLVIVFFFILWLGVLACTMLIPITVQGAHIGQTRYCEDASVPSFAFAAIFAPLIHDTFVFFAITWRLAQNSHINMTFKDGIKVALFGKYLPAFTRGMLIDGQRYYLLTLISNLATVILAFDNSVPTPMRAMSSALNLALTNIMACRVYRKMKNGLIPTSEDISTINTHPKGQALSFLIFGSRPMRGSGHTGAISRSEMEAVASLESTFDANNDSRDGRIIEIKTDMDSSLEK